MPRSTTDGEHAGKSGRTGIPLITAKTIKGRQLNRQQSFAKDEFVVDASARLFRSEELGLWS